MTDDLKPGDIVHVRMVITKIADGKISGVLSSGDAGWGVVGIPRHTIANVQPRPPEPLKVGERVRCIGPKGSGNDGEIKAAHDGQFCVLWNGGRLNIHREADLERCE